MPAFFCGRHTILSSVNGGNVMQGCKNPGRQVALATKDF
jgi:hypothetical protein